LNADCDDDALLVLFAFLCVNLTFVGIHVILSTDTKYIH